ncbi:histidine ammonia-lyase [bacterium]|nr:histidine ammonia-lyase [bacterium]
MTSLQGATRSLRGDGLSLEAMADVATGQVRISLSEEAIQKMNKAHETVLAIIEKGDPVYGVNTGFGKFSEVQISREELATLQVNLVRSHACGVGDPLASEIVRMILVSKANSLTKGYSGCRPEIAQSMIDLYNHDVLPVIPAHGSVGASGDLAPLAHMALVMMGEGEAIVKGARMSGSEALQKAGIQPIVLGPKEGLSIINGTQVSTALAVEAWLKLEKLTDAADLACAWTVEGVAGLTSAFDPRIHEVRGHDGAKTSAARMRAALQNSDILASDEAKRRVQDPYAIRCAPQVHGAVRNTLESTRTILETEINGVTDNPLVFADTGEVISGGNFHAEPIAFVSDQLSIAGAELASISERRTFLLTDPQISGLPAFLVKQGGLNSGLMIHQVTQAALVSANKTLAHPASVDSIPTSAGKEDHVSMATWAGFKAIEIVDRAAIVLGIEMLAAAQAVDMRKPLAPGPAIAKRQVGIRTVISTIEQDRISYPDINAARDWLLKSDWKECS